MGVVERGVREVLSRLREVKQHEITLPILRVSTSASGLLVVV